MPITALVALALFSLGALLAFGAALIVARGSKNKKVITVATDDDGPDIAEIVLNRLSGKK